MTISIDKLKSKIDYYERILSPPCYPVEWVNIHGDFIRLLPRTDEQIQDKIETPLILMTEKSYDSPN